MKELHQAVRERSGNRCEICQRIFPENELCAHHIRSQKSRPDLKFDPTNCLCVCQEDHNKCHSGQITRERQESILKGLYKG